MATNKKTIDENTQELRAQQVSFSVEPGTKVKITVEVGEEIVDGKIPVTLHVEQSGREPNPAVEIVYPEPKPLSEHAVPAVTRVRAAFDALKSRAQTYDLAAWLFIFAVAVYLLTRLIGLTQFPIYFFTDEAIQSQSIIDLMNNGYRDPNGIWFPTYFQNGRYFNIGVSVYLQWLPAILFGKSAVATRATSVLVTLIAAVSIGLLLRDVFKLKYWWTGTLFLSITPSWFLHSRTAFETAEFVAFYAGTLCAYLFYRCKSPRYLYLTVFLGALAFYTYSPAQVIMPLTAIGFLISDWRYHWENRRTLLIGLAMGVVFALPYVRSSINNPDAAVTHLHTLWSYWFENITLSEKIARYISEFGIGLSPWYWYIPNDRDLSRHLMKDYGHVMLATLPFALLGMASILRNLRFPAYRAILIALLISPAASALVQTSITRMLVFVVPLAILTAIGLERVLEWIEAPKKHLVELREGPGPNPARIVAALIILITGIFIASAVNKSINGLTLGALWIILALQVSGILKWMAQSVTRADAPPQPRFWNLSPTFLAISVFVILAGVNIRMLNDALKNGPLWYRDYGLSGMQYGAFQIFDLVEEYLNEHPDAKVIFSPAWANGTQVVARFFLGDNSSVELGSVQGHITQKLPLDDNTLFIMTPQEYDLVKQSEKFADIDVETIVPYPDGNPGFYFVQLRYVDNIDEIFAAEKSVRQALQEATLRIDGQDVKLRFSYLDGQFQDKWIALVFDNDPFTVAKTFDTNPFVIEMTFPKPRILNGISIIIGSANVQITLKCYATPETQPVVYTFEGQGTKDQPELSFDLDKPTQAQVLDIEVLVLHASDQSNVHIWELKLR